MREALGLGVWASGGSGRFPALAETVPRYVESITIFAHPDAEQKAQELAALVRSRVLEVRIKREFERG